MDPQFSPRQQTTAKPIDVAPPPPPPAQQVTTQPAGGKKSPVLTVMLVVLLLLAAAAAVGVYFWQQKEIDKLEKEVAALKLENGNLRYDLNDLRADNQSVNEARVVLASSTNKEVNALGKDLKDFYGLWVVNKDCKEANINTQACVEFKPYLSAKAVTQLQKSTTSSLISCSQTAGLVYSIDAPKISGSSATAQVRILPAGAPVQATKASQLTLVKSKNIWLIDKFSCAS